MSKRKRSGRSRMRAIALFSGAAALLSGWRIWLDAHREAMQGNRPSEASDTTEATGSRWEARPLLAFFLRVSALLLPVAASVGTSILLATLLPQPGSSWQVVAWWGLIIGVSTTVLFVVDRLARRLAPIALLLNLSMIFPDQAPSQYRAALRSGSSVKNLKRQLEEAERLADGGDTARAAGFILQLSTALNSHDRSTRGHAERVRAYTELIAKEVGLTNEERGKLRWVSLLHDIGKLKISADILNKPGPLDDEEWAEMKQHPIHGLRICAPLLEWLGPWGHSISDHHERYDGTGYPAGKRGEEINLGARIIAVADAFDVMTTVRTYRKPLSAAAARQELAKQAGSQFDPHAVRAFLRVGLGRLRWVAGPLSWIALLPALRFVAIVKQVGTSVGLASVAVATAGTVFATGVIETPGSDSLDLLPAPDPLQAISEANDADRLLLALAFSTTSPKPSASTTTATTGKGKSEGGQEPGTKGQKGKPEEGGTTNGGTGGGPPEGKGDGGPPDGKGDGGPPDGKGDGGPPD
ncbi:MAG: HD-GYP domain-containing protein, partial [Acidimicrobiia bacterium]